MITENLGVFLTDLGVPCTCGAYAFTGVLDMPGQTLNMGSTNVISTMYELTVQSSDVAAGAIDSGSLLTVNGRSFVVRDVLPLDDGAFSNLTLSQ